MKTTARNPFFQHTLADQVKFVGVGIHSGETVHMTLLPAAADTGIVFERVDAPAGKGLVQALWHRVSDTLLSTTITNEFGVSVSTIEHLMAALAASGVDNCLVQLDNQEVPIMDGSSQVYLDQIDQVGLQRQSEERRAIVITKPVWAFGDGKTAAYMPFPQAWFDMTIRFDAAAIGTQHYSMPMNEAFFRAEIARARTFGFVDQVEALRAKGLARGGSLDNAVVIGEEGVLNKEGLRYRDEFVRHKLLDAVGDLALAGAPIIGRFEGHCSGHQMNNQLLHNLLLDTASWRLTTVREATGNWHRLIQDDTYEELLDLALDHAVSA